MTLDLSPTCLFFDVFGTCVDWRKTVTETLWKSARDALSAPSSSIASDVRVIATDMTYEHWGDLAQEWRNGYLKFCRDIATDPGKSWKTVDEHHLESLRDILTRRGLILPRNDSTANDLVHEGSLWDEAQLQDINLVWHRLDPWPDTCRGLKELNRQVWTCTLSNGNLSLLQDMVSHGSMGFTHIFSAEMFQSYKPNPKVYLGAAERIGLKPEQCSLVAAHLDDLKAAKKCGFSAIYVERPQEERHPEMREEGIPDIWVKEGEGGFVAVAERLGIQVQR